MGCSNHAIRFFKSWSTALFLLCSLEAFAQDVLWLPSAPKPVQVAEAKSGFDAGIVVAMRNADAARFSGILNVGLPSLPPEDGAYVSRYCIAAARKTLHGRVRLYAGELVAPGRNDSAVCEQDFEKWLSSQQLLQESENPNGWTEVSSCTSSRSSLNGDKYSRTSTIYRANTIDPANDYFMFVQENTANPLSNSVVVSNSVQLSASYGNGSALRDASAFDWGPPSGVSSADTFTIGSKVPVQAGSAAFTVSWNGVAGLAINVSAVPLDPLALQFQQQVATSGSTTLNVPSLTYNAGVVFSAPKGIASLLGISLLTSYLQDAIGSPFQYPPAGQFNLQGASPVLTTPKLDLFVTAGSASNTFQITASSYLNWTLSVPDWITTDGPVTGGQGSQMVSFSVSSAAELGTEGTISLDTSPSFASPSVSSGPLQIRVHVGSAPPASGVLFAGGQDWSGNTLASAEIWDPATKSVVPTNGPMGTGRSQHTATALQNGTILIAGGFGSDGNALNTTEIFDPATDTFMPGPNMVFPHAEHTATLLQDGTVLIAGGSNATSAINLTANAEIYDPGAHSMTQVGNMTEPRQNGAAALLNSGEVLVFGGNNFPVPVDIYDPIRQQFSSGPTIQTLGQGEGQVAIHLANDQVLAIGEQFVFAAQSPEGLYTPSANTFSPTSGSTPNIGVNPAGLLLPDQTAVLFAGRRSPSGPAIPTGLTVGYSPSTQDFTRYPSGSEQRVLPTATLVPELFAAVVAGGVPANSGSTQGTAVELFDATQKTWSSGGAMSTARTGMTSTYFTNTSGLTTTSQQR